MRYWHLICSKHVTFPFLCIITYLFFAQVLLIVFGFWRFDGIDISHTLINMILSIYHTIALKSRLIAFLVIFSKIFSPVNNSGKTNELFFKYKIRPATYKVLKRINLIGNRDLAISSFECVAEKLCQLWLFCCCCCCCCFCFCCLRL